ncbi:MAG: 6-pyruvoyl-tetrahydropterin synthase-related protein [Anaerolineae bacterium]|nr:6-pyruvoyl-tetrahydropterin synthase-related protein [Thermoflexales bacterium]MDW8407585.1 6-pyruvoyl-tetrahydropterin synthase-related protein [Anaerolineae bacterium]
MRRSFHLSSVAAGLTAVLVCSAASAVIWMGPGILNTRAGGDSPFLLQRVYELSAILRAGVFPARWMPDAAYGLGYPFFHFYAALPYYLAAGLNVIGFDLLTAIQLTQTVGMFAAAGAMWIYARRYLAPAGAALAVAAYTLAPFHLVNVYVRGDSLSEFYAFVWYPLILWGIDRVTDQHRAPADKQAATILVLALSLAGLVLTHNVSAMIFAPFIVIYALAAVWRAQGAFLRMIAQLASAAGLAVSLSAWFWLPALGDAALVQLGDQTTGYFHFVNHFRSTDLIQARLVFDYTLSASQTPFAMGLVHTVLAAAGAVMCIRRAIAGTARSAVGLTGAQINPKATTNHRLAWVVLFVLATVMITPLSHGVWENAPLLALAQFPWRFLSVQALFAALLAGCLAHTPHDREIQPRTQHTQGATSTIRRALDLLYIPTLLLLLLIQSLPGLPNERLNIRAEDVTPHTLQLYEWLTGNIGTTIRAEYLPATAQPRPFTGPALLNLPSQAWVIRGAIGASQREEASPTRQVWRVEIESDTATFAVPLLYWPAWRARLADGTQIPLRAYVGSGWVELTLPRGRQRFELWLDATPFQRAGETASLAALAISAAIGIASIAIWIKRHGWRYAGQMFARAVLPAGGTAIGLLIAPIMVRAFSPPYTAPPIQAVDFAARPFPHRGPLVFVDANGQTYTLTQAVVTPTQVRAGEMFTLTTTWEGNRAPSQTGLQQILPQGGYFAPWLFRFTRDESFGSTTQSVHRASSQALPGPLPLTLIVRDAEGRPLTPTMGTEPALSSLSITAAQIISPPSILRVFPNGIVFWHVDWVHTGARTLCIRPTWSTQRVRADALKVALRLRGSDGRDIARVDGEAQAGLAPTWAWPIGAPIQDSYCIEALDTLHPGEPYTLLVRWYRVLDHHVEGEIVLVGTRKTGPFDVQTPTLALSEHRYQPPAMDYPRAAVFGDAIRLLGYDLLIATERLTVTFHWQTQAPIARDYKLFVHLSPADRPEPARQVDRLTLDGLYPTGMWQVGEIISETIVLDLTGLSAGRYRLGIGWYDPNSLARLPAQENGQIAPDNWLELTTIELPAEDQR